MSTNVKPKYQLEALGDDYEYEVNVIGYVEKEIKGRKTPVRRREMKVEKRTGGFMLYTPKGESIHLRDEAAVRALGINPDGSPMLVDMDSGDVVPNDEMSYKDVAAVKGHGKARQRQHSATIS